MGIKRWLGRYWRVNLNKCRHLTATNAALESSRLLPRAREWAFGWLQGTSMNAKFSMSLRLVIGCDSGRLYTETID